MGIDAIFELTNLDPESNSRLLGCYPALVQR